jgi:hypothetical protein
VAKAKGSTLIGAVKFLRRRRDEASALLPERLQHYLSERISEAAWYPEEDLLELVRATAKLIPGPAAETFALMGRATAQAHQEGVYAHLLEGGATPAAGFALWSTMHDTGRLRTTREAPRRLRIDLVDYALPSREMCAIVGAYIEESLRMGGVSARVEKLECRVAGAGCCRWRCNWGD